MPQGTSGINGPSIPSTLPDPTKQPEDSHKEGKLGHKKVKNLISNYEQMSLKKSATEIPPYSHKKETASSTTPPPVKPKSKKLAQRRAVLKTPTTSVNEKQAATKKPKQPHAQKGEKPPIKPKPDHLKHLHAKTHKETKHAKPNEATNPIINEPVYTNSNRPKGSFENFEPIYVNTQPNNHTEESIYSELTPETRLTQEGPYSSLNFQTPIQENSPQATSNQELSYPKPTAGDEYSKLNHTPHGKNTYDTPRRATSLYDTPRRTNDASPPAKPAQNHAKYYPAGNLYPEDVEEPIYESEESIEALRQKILSQTTTTLPNEDIYEYPEFSDQQKATNAINKELKPFNELLAQLRNTLSERYNNSKKYHTREVNQALSKVSKLGQHEKYNKLTKLLSESTARELTPNQYKELKSLSKWINKQVAPALKLCGHYGPEITGLHLPQTLTIKPEEPTDQTQSAKQVLKQLATLEQGSEQEQGSIQSYKKTLGIMQRAKGKTGERAEKAMKALAKVSSDSRLESLSSLLNKATVDDSTLTTKELKAIQKNLAWINTQIVPALKLCHENDSFAVSNALLKLPLALTVK